MKSIRICPVVLYRSAAAQQCLINLLGIAVKFTDSGYVSLSVGQNQQGARSCIRFDVEDTGIGIPRDKQQEIFKVFSQAEAGTARKYGGSGLGMTLPGG